MAAQFELAQRYYDGRGTRASPAQALFWLEKAAAQGIPEACTLLGIAHITGLRLPQNAEMGVHWFRIAAEKGEKNGQNHLGLAYLSGKGVEKDAEQAELWLSRAALAGLPDAQLGLALLYEKDELGESDPIRAYAWVALAVDQRASGASTLQRRLGVVLSAAQIAEAGRLADELREQVRGANEETAPSR